MLPASLLDATSTRLTFAYLWELGAHDDVWLLYKSDVADETTCVDLGEMDIIEQKKKQYNKDN